VQLDVERLRSRTFMSVVRKARRPLAGEPIHRRNARLRRRFRRRSIKCRMRADEAGRALSGYHKRRRPG